jgi:acetyltransferase-like isoleucine patch superfamily enzyme
MKTKIIQELSKYVMQVKLRIMGVEIGRNATFTGLLGIDKAPDSAIRIGDNCVFNSWRYTQPIILHTPCRFTTLTPGSEIVIGNNSGASGAVLIATKSIRIGDNVLIGANSALFDSDFHNLDPAKRSAPDSTSRPIVIEDNVFLGLNCFVLKGVRIGRNSVIGANSVVMTDIPPDSIAMGNPCKVILKRNWAPSEEQIPK